MVVAVLMRVVQSQVTPFLYTDFSTLPIEPILLKCQCIFSSDLVTRDTVVLTFRFAAFRVNRASRRSSLLH